jgi:hypothetical protein
MGLEKVASSFMKWALAEIFGAKAHLEPILAPVAVLRLTLSSHSLAIDLFS